MATGNLNLVVGGGWLGGRHSQLPFGAWPVTRWPVCCAFRRFAGECLRAAFSVRRGLLGGDNFCCTAPFNLFFQAFPYGNQRLVGVGWGIRHLGLLRRLDQLEVAIA